MLDRHRPREDLGESFNHLRVNDPERPCWGFFRDVFQLKELNPPSDEYAARARLRHLLREAAARHPYRLLKKALLSSPATMNSLRQFVACLRNEGGGTTVFDSGESHARTQARRDSQDDPYWREAFDYLLSRLWVMGDGRPIPSHHSAYHRLRTSTKEPLRAWLPEKSGVITYLRNRARHIIGEYYEELQGRDYMVSFDRLREGFLHFSEDGESYRVRRMDVNNEGEVVDIYRGGAQPTTFLRDDRFIETARGQELTRRARYQPTAPADNVKPAASGPTREEEFEQRFQDALRDYPDDWPIRLFDPIFSVTSYGESRKPSWRTAAVRRLITRLKVYDPSIVYEPAIATKPEVDTNKQINTRNLAEILREWDGVHPLVEVMPEIAVAARQWRQHLAGVKRREPLSTPAEEKAARLLRDAPLRQLYPNPENAPATREAHAAIAAEQVALQALLNSADQEPVMEPSERPDYAFLAQHAGEQPDLTLGPEELACEMRRLAKSFCRQLRGQGGSGPWLAKLIEEAEWDPAQRMLGQLLWDTAGTVAAGWQKRAARKTGPQIDV